MKLPFCAFVLFLAACCIARAEAPAVVPGGFNETSAMHAAHAQSGLDRAADAAGCCWMGPETHFTAWQPAGADRLIFSMFAPDYALPHGLAVPVNVDIDGKHLQRCCAHQGNIQIEVPLSPSTTAHLVDVRIAVLHTFRPASVGHGTDRRSLSVLLRGIVFENSATGEDLAGSPEPAVAPAMPPGISAAIIVLGGAIAIALTMVRASYGLNLLIFSVPFAFAVPMGPTTATLPKAVLLGVALALVVKSDLRLPRVRSAGFTIFASFAALAASMILSSLHAPAIDAAVRETLKTCEYSLMLIVAYSAFRIDPNETSLLRTLSLTVVAVVAVATVELFAGSPQVLLWNGNLVARLAGPLEGPNQLGAFLGLVIPVALAAVLFRGRNVMLTAVIVTSSIATLATFSRGSIAALIPSCAVVAIARFWPRKLRPTLALLGIIAFAGFGVTLAVGCGAIHAVAVFGAPQETRGGLGSRTLLWHAAIHQWREHPWLGDGPGNFELQLNAEQGVRTHANSLFLNTLAEQGVVGLAAAVALVVIAVIALARGPASWLGVGVLGATIGLTLHQLVDTLSIYPKVGSLWVILLAVSAASVDALRRQREDVVDFHGVVAEGEA